MTRYSILLSFCFLVSFSNAQGISFFHDSWENALAKAQSENKIIFVDAYAKWCGPCKRMAANVFTQEKVGSYFNEHFISVKMDMEETEGVKFGRKYPVTGYPTLLFLDPEGNILKKVVGSKQAEDLIHLGIQAIKSFDNSGQYAERYETGDRDFDLMLMYVKELNKVDKPSLKIANEYLNTKPDISISQKAEFLLASVLESDSKLFNQLIDLKKEAVKVSSRKAFENCVSEACLKTVEKAVEYDYPDLMEEAIRSFKSADIGDAKQFESEARLYYHALMGEFDQWKNLSKKFLKKNGKKNPGIYKEHLAQISKHFDYLDSSKIYYYELMDGLLKYEDSAENYMQYIRTLMNDSKNTKAMGLCKEAVKKFKEHVYHMQFKQMLEFLKKSGAE